MTSVNKALMCRYHYDPLDRLAVASPAGAEIQQRFYQKNRLSTEIQGQIQRSIVQPADFLLAQLTSQNGQIASALLATDRQGSVLLGLDVVQRQAVAYLPYGFRHPQPSLPGFNGEQPDPVTGHYLLGNGYRAFNPVLMRFNSPDSLSPFGEGGLNAYAYCVGDPVNRVDPTGHTWGWVKLILRAAGFMSESPTDPALKSFKRLGSSASRKITKPDFIAQNIEAPSLPKFLRELPQAENIPPHLRATRRLPPIPEGARLHNQWTGKTASPKEFHIYHSPAGVTRKVKPVDPMERFMLGYQDGPEKIFPMDTLYETAGPSARRQLFLEKVEDGKAFSAWLVSTAKRLRQRGVKHRASAWNDLL